MDHVPQAVRFAIQHAGASSGERISPHAFMDALSDRGGGDSAKKVVSAFLDEADPTEFADLVACQVTTFAALATLAKRYLPEFHVNRVLLDELAPRTES